MQASGGFIGMLYLRTHIQVHPTATRRGMNSLQLKCAGKTLLTKKRNDLWRRHCLPKIQLRPITPNGRTRPNQRDVVLYKPEVFFKVGRGCRSATEPYALGREHKPTQVPIGIEWLQRRVPHRPSALIADLLLHRNPLPRLLVVAAQECLQRCHRYEPPTPDLQTRDLFFSDKIRHRSWGQPGPPCRFANPHRQLLFTFHVFALHDASLCWPSLSDATLCRQL
jgi:hypothetical protein